MSWCIYVGRIILNCVVKEWCVATWSGLISLRIAFICGLLWAWKWTCGLHTIRSLPIRIFLTETGPTFQRLWCHYISLCSYVSEHRSTVCDTLFGRCIASCDLLSRFVVLRRSLFLVLPHSVASFRLCSSHLLRSCTAFHSSRNADTVYNN